MDFDGDFLVRQVHQHQYRRIGIVANGEYRWHPDIHRAGLAFADFAQADAAADHVAGLGQQRIIAQGLGVDVQRAVAERTFVDRLDHQFGGFGTGEAGVHFVGPLHRRAHGQPLGPRQVLAHADFFAVADDRCAGQGEQQRMRHRQAVFVAFQHGRQPPTNAAVVGAHVGIGGESPHHLLALFLGQALQIQLVMVAYPGGVLRAAGRRRLFGQRTRQGGGVAAGQRQEIVVVGPEVQQQGEPVAIAEVVGVVLRLHIHLAQQHGFGAAQGDEVAEMFEQPVALGAVAFAGLFDQVRGGIDAEAGNPQAQPERHDPLDLLDHPRVGQVQVRLVLVEQVPVVLAGFLVPGPDAVLDGGEDRFDAVVRLVGPEVVVAEGRVAVAARLLEPAVRDGGVLHHQLDDHVQAEFLGLFQQVDHVGQVAETRVDLQVIADVVAGVLEGRAIEGHQPDGGGAEAAHVVQAFGDAAQIAAAVAVVVAEEGRVDLVDHGVAVPEGAHVRLPVDRE